MPLIEARESLERALEEMDAKHQEFILLMGVLHETKR